MLTVFSEYNAVKNSINELLDMSGYRNDYIAKKIGISNANFSMKKQRKSWSDIEVQKIIDILTNVNEDIEDMLMLKIAKARENEETIGFDDYKKEVAKWK